MMPHLLTIVLWIHVSQLPLQMDPPLVPPMVQRQLPCQAPRQDPHVSQLPRRMDPRTLTSLQTRTLKILHLDCVREIVMMILSAKTS